MLQEGIWEDQATINFLVLSPSLSGTLDKIKQKVYIDTHSISIQNSLNDIISNCQYRLMSEITTHTSDKQCNLCTGNINCLR